MTTPNPPRRRGQVIARKARTETVQFEAKYNQLKTELLYDLNSLAQDIEAAQEEFRARAVRLNSAVQKFEPLTKTAHQVHELTLDFFDLSSSLEHVQSLAEEVSDATPS